MNRKISEKQKRCVLAIIYYLSPSLSGAIRNYNILKNLHNFNWNVKVLIGKEKDSVSVDTFEGFEIYKATNLQFNEYFVALRNYFVKDKRAMPKKSSDIMAVNKDEKSRTLWQRIKDKISEIVTFPDNCIGWLPFAVWKGIKARKGVDVIYAVGQPWTCFLVGYLLKLILRKPLVIDFMDPWKASVWKSKRGNILEGIECFLEDFMVKKADFVIANTETLRENFITRLKVPEKKIEVITCGYDQTDFVNKRPKEHIGFVITHTGICYKKRNPKNFLKAVQSLIEEGLIPVDKIKINLVGRNSINDQELSQLLNEMPIINQIPWVTHEEVLDYLYQSDLLLLLQPETKLQTPGKLYEYLASNIPIIAIGEKDGSIDRLLQKDGWGKVIDNNNLLEIKEAVYRCYTDKICDVKRNGVEKYEYTQLAKNLAGILEREIYEEN